MPLPPSAGTGREVADLLFANCGHRTGTLHALQGTVAHADYVMIVHAWGENQAR